MINRNLLLSPSACAILFLVSGCHSNQETIAVKNPDPMIQVRATLLNYVKGRPLTSEVTTFDNLVEAVRKSDPAKADILKEGLDEIKRAKGNPAPKARELMRKLGLDENETK